jgi:hypothetical protein
MKTLKIRTPRTEAVYEEWLATKGKFGPDAHGTFQGLKIWCVMEQLEHENIALRRLLNEALSKIPYDPKTSTI